MAEKHEENKANLESKIEAGKLAAEGKKKEVSESLASLKEKFLAFKHD